MLRWNGSTGLSGQALFSSEHGPSGYNQMAVNAGSPAGGPGYLCEEEKREERHMAAAGGYHIVARLFKPPAAAHCCHNSHASKSPVLVNSPFPVWNHERRARYNSGKRSGMRRGI